VAGMPRWIQPGNVAHRTLSRRMRLVGKSMDHKELLAGCQGRNSQLAGHGRMTNSGREVWTHRNCPHETRGPVRNVYTNFGQALRRLRSRPAYRQMSTVVKKGKLLTIGGR
jgi:hypothetical protein